MKRLIRCLDGTCNRPDQTGNPTRVTEIMRAIRPTDDAGHPQIVFHDQGVGTRGRANRLLGGMLGKGLDENRHESHRLLVHNYAPDDEIYLFGFSRGANDARRSTELGIVAMG